MNHSLSKQSGHAAILFAMIIPALFGLFTLASDGARALQTKARIQDAAEVATLAVSAHNADNTDSSGADSGSQINRDIATDFLEQYMVDMTEVSDLKIIKKNCDDIKECRDGLNIGEARFFQYEVEAKTDHKSWFPGNEAIVGFGESFTVAGAATARKYQSEAVDVVFAADFSGSMADGWNGGNKKKYKDLRDIIEEVTVELEKFNNLNNTELNTVGVSAFNFYTYSLVSAPGNSKKYCYVDQATRNRNGIDADQTVKNMFIVKTNCAETSNKIFTDISLTSDYAYLNSTIKGFKPDNGTASYQGIIRGAQLLSEGDNPRRLLIVLSDGDDWKEHAGYSQELVDAGMCDDIKTKLNSELTPSGQRITAKMSVVGFDYDVNDNRALLDCAGEENVFKAQDKQDILDKILELITEEIGHLK